jgi:hypothetical protein
MTETLQISQYCKVVMKFSVMTSTVLLKVFFCFQIGYDISLNCCRTVSCRQDSQCVLAHISF